ncbi:UvrD-helicase domain-containing protein [Cryobacterium sp. BB307]|uniref:UvrD-helicase domain-containing protein n=1 Tax=Cryobacterium sp. BB307 TaxID=2716317 RepID=UPI0014485F6A|nr:UvrD-helicase domain-containing protein [Cryobacterium sp. BB307]
MTGVWRPSEWGKRFTRADDWRVSVVENGILIETGELTQRIALDEADAFTVRTGALWSVIRVAFPDFIELRGIPNRTARQLRRTVEAERSRYLEELRVAQLKTRFDETANRVVAWAREFFESSRSHLSQRGWLTREHTARWLEAKPSDGFGELLVAAELEEHRAAQRGEVLEAIDLWQADLQTYVASWNEHYLEAELETHRDFFARVESSPLTEEQARAVVCFDNRVQVIASAGSGKTSTMIAKAGYALHRGLIPADKILMLAFNAKAAKELKERVNTRLTPLGLDAEKVEANTFHSFGLHVIGHATGRKPSLAPWVDHAGGDIRQVMQIVDELRDSDPGFRTEWDLFRLVFGRDLPDFGEEEDEPEAWDPVKRNAGFRTLQGEVVRSQGERLIADWLFYNGVEYEYERPYEVDTASADRIQYRPDFYYPSIDVYHEHWALNEAGEAPPEFESYLEDLQWKRATHAENGTTLLETTMASIWNGRAFDYLTNELSYRGIRLDPNPDRPVVGEPPIENERLVTTFRTFLVHAKSNQLSDEQLHERMLAESKQKFQFRHGKFLRLFSAIRRRWEEKLAEGGWIDFEDMLNLAADHLESGRWASPFELVMVDEMQDASHARARLVRALIREPGRYLFAVGDDWQSINRFAGADLSVMTQFEQWFGAAEVLRLERTFRCPQSICDVSSRFVSKNPEQLRKRVVSSTRETPPTLAAISVARDDHVRSAIRNHLEKLDKQVTGEPRPATVFILGRYRFHESNVPSGDLKKFKNLDVAFSTMHASKGLEADYIVIPGMTRGSYGFPSRIVDDPVLRLAMPAAESFPRAEERRLFYVALTRARRAVTLLTVKGRESAFLGELVKEHGLVVRDAYGAVASTVSCTECADGVMVKRKGKFGSFLGCSNFPKCRNTMKVDADGNPVDKQNA